MLVQDKLPFPFNFVNRMATTANRLGIRLPRLTAEDIQTRAQKQTGLTDFGDPFYVEGLSVLMESARTDKVNALGRIIVDNMAMQYAVNRLQWVEMQKRQPSAFETPLQPPLIILGLPRSGTTVLHRMMAADPAHQAIPLWRLIKPFPPLDGGKDNRYDEVAKQMEQTNRLRPELKSKHLITPDEPEECMTIQGMSFYSPVFYASVPVYHYLEWYINSDRQKMHEEYASMLRWYQAADPRRLVLKSPSHTPELDHLLAVIPNALIVQTHRDPVKVVNSMNSLFHTNHSNLMRRYAPEKIATTNLNLLQQFTEMNLALRAKHNPNICDVDFGDLVTDPIGIAQKIYAHFGLAWTDVFEEKLRGYMNNNPQHKHGKHRYSAADFNLTDDEIRARFRPYIERFGV